MAGKVLRLTVVHRNPETLMPEALIEGTELPEWAEGLVHDDDLETPAKAAAKAKAADK